VRTLALLAAFAFWAPGLPLPHACHDARRCYVLGSWTCVVTVGPRRTAVTDCLWVPGHWLGQPPRIYPLRAT
jgi:hypothetical protein